LRATPSALLTAQHCAADVNVKDKFGDTALGWAANRGHAAVVKALIDAQADINCTNPEGKTALSWAAGYGHADALKVG
jgi:ankyrin repeat protein